MSAHGFRSVVWAASVAGAALGCYLVSLNVASERAELERVESRIVETQRDIRVLQTEIGTRGRLAQLERWNVNFIRLSAPGADQFVEGGFQLASLVKPDAKPAIEAPVILAAAPVDAARRPVTSDGADASPPAIRPQARPAVDTRGELLHTASYARPETRQSAPAKSAPVKKTETAKPAKSAAADPLSPLPGATVAAMGTASPRTAPTQSSSAKPKDTGTTR